MVTGEPIPIGKIELTRFKEDEAHEITEAEVERIHSKGSPHQHLDPNPHKIHGEAEVIDDYSQQMRGTLLAAAEVQRDNIRDKMKDTLLEAMPKQTIPRYLRRAVWSQRPGRIHKAIGRAISEGWTKVEMVKQVKMIIGHQLENKEYEVQETT